MPDETTSLSIERVDPADTARGVGIPVIIDRADSAFIRLALCAPGMLVARFGTVA